MSNKSIRSWVSIDTLNRFPRSTFWLILGRQSIDTWLTVGRFIVGQVLTDSLMNWSKISQRPLNQLSTEMLMKVSAEGVSINYRSRVKVLDWYLTMDAFSINDLAQVHKFIATKSLMKFCLHLTLHSGSHDHTVKLYSLNHPVTSIIYVTIASLCILLGLLTHFKYNRLVAWYW